MQIEANVLCLLVVPLSIQVLLHNAFRLTDSDSELHPTKLEIEWGEREGEKERKSENEKGRKKEKGERNGREKVITTNKRFWGLFYSLSISPVVSCVWRRRRKKRRERQFARSLARQLVWNAAKIVDAGKKRLFSPLLLLFFSFSLRSLGWPRPFNGLSFARSQPEYDIEGYQTQKWSKTFLS